MVTRIAVETTTCLHGIFATDIRSTVWRKLLKVKVAQVGIIGDLPGKWDAIWPVTSLQPDSK